MGWLEWEYENDYVTLSLNPFPRERDLPSLSLKSVNVICCLNVVLVLSSLSQCCICYVFGAKCSRYPVFSGHLLHFRGENVTGGGKTKKPHKCGAAKMRNIDMRAVTMADDPTVNILAFFIVVASSQISPHRITFGSCP